MQLSSYGLTGYVSLSRLFMVKAINKKQEIKKVFLNQLLSPGK